MNTRQYSSTSNLALDDFLIFRLISSLRVMTRREAWPRPGVTVGRPGGRGDGSVTFRAA
jgi:hypothetical protein